MELYLALRESAPLKADSSYLLSTVLRKSVAFLMQGDALALQGHASILYWDALALQGVVKFNSLRINEMLY